MEALLTHQVLDALLSLYDAGSLKTSHQQPEPGASQRWRLVTSKGSYLLVVHEDRPFWDLVHEKDLILFLAQDAPALHGVHVPHPVKNVAGGYFFPVAERQYAWLMEPPPGRQLAPFELDASAAAQLGRHLARFHLAARGFHGQRRHQGLREIGSFMKAATGTGLLDVTRAVGEELAWLRRHVRPLPRGTLHGDPGPHSLRFVDGVLAAVEDFKEASRGPLMLDVGTALLLWAASPGGLDPVRATALWRAYAEVRPVRPSEKRGLYAMTRLAAVRLVAQHVRDFELGQRASAPARYRDHRPHLERMVALGRLGRRGFARLLDHAVGAAP